MPDEFISNSGVSPIPPTRGVPEKPTPGPEEQGEKTFALPKEGTSPTAAGAEKPKPMDVAKDSAQKSAQMSPEELHEQVSSLKDKLSEVQGKVQDPTYTKSFTNDHYTAMGKVIDKMNPDMKTIASTTNSSFEPPQKGGKESVLNWVANWINGSQQTLSGALNYLSSDPSPNPASFLKLQYAVQRASQRGTLFASIVGASTSGIKTILSTQLG